MKSSRNTEAARRFAERRRREDEAPRLLARVPDLATLDLEISERKGEAAAEAAHVRRIVVVSAPALFEIPCGDPACQDGGHDLTHPVLRALERRERRFEGEDACHGRLGASPCGRTLRWVGRAGYVEGR
jgi:hypothetical protein